MGNEDLFIVDIGDKRKKRYLCHTNFLRSRLFNIPEIFTLFTYKFKFSKMFNMSKKLTVSLWFAT